MSKLPDVPPKLFTLSAVAIGYLLIDDLSANEQNALGNWLMLVAQVLCTNAFYKQVQADNMMSDKETVVMINKVINAMQKELNDIRNN